MAKPIAYQAQPFRPFRHSDTAIAASMAQKASINMVLELGTSETERSIKSAMAKIPQGLRRVDVSTCYSTVAAVSLVDLMGKMVQVRRI